MYYKAMSHIPGELKRACESIIFGEVNELKNAISYMMNVDPNGIMLFCKSTLLMMSAVFDKGDGIIFGAVAGHPKINLNSPTNLSDVPILAEIIDSGRADLLHVLISTGRDFRTTDMKSILEQTKKKHPGSWVDHLDSSTAHRYKIRDSRREGVKDCIRMIANFRKSKKMAILKSRLFLKTPLEMAAVLYIIWNRIGTQSSNNKRRRTKKDDLNKIFSHDGFLFFDLGRFMRHLGSRHLTEDIVLEIIKRRVCRGSAIVLGHEQIVKRAQEIFGLF